MIKEIGIRSDGTVIGEDENGVLYSGTKRQAGFDELTRTVEQTDTGYRVKFFVGDQLIGKGELSADAFDPNAPWQAAEVLQTFNGQTFERTTTVIDWSAL